MDSKLDLIKKRITNYLKNNVIVEATKISDISLPSFESTTILTVKPQTLTDLSKLAEPVIETNEDKHIRFKISKNLNLSDKISVSKDKTVDKFYKEVAEKSEEEISLIEKRAIETIPNLTAIPIPPQPQLPIQLSFCAPYDKLSLFNQNFYPKPFLDARVVQIPQILPTNIKSKTEDE